jgi:DNA polymerase-3 subunit chi
MAEVLFYHLTERTLEQALPPLIEKSLERGWNVVIQGNDETRLEALDAHLWSYREDSFLPHGMVRDGTESLQPVFLSTRTDNPNGAAIRFMIDAAEPPDLAAYVRGVYLFDGHDAAALEKARERWTVEKSAGHTVTYWQQQPDGRWTRKA